MIRFKIFIAVALLGAGAYTASAQEECVGIESDVARLECFDEAFSNLSQIQASPQEAFQALFDFGNQTGALTFNAIGQLAPTSSRSLISYRMRETCKLDVLALIGQDGSASFRQFSLDVSEIQEFSRRRSHQVQLSMTRGNSVSVKASDVSSRNLPNKRTENIEQYWDFRAQSEWENRSAPIRLVAEAEDRKQALQLFGELVSACQRD